MSGEIVSATLSFSFDASSTDSSAPQIRSGYSSANNIVVPKEFEGNSCIEYYHSYGESPSDLVLKGIGVLTRVETTVEYIEETLTVTGDNSVSLNNDPIGIPTISVQGNGFIEITESVVNGVIKSARIPVSIITKFDPVDNTIKLSTPAGNEGKYYGLLTVGYSTSKHLYKVSYENTTCPYEITDPNSPALSVSDNILIIGTFSTGISTATGSRDSKCCDDRYDKLLSDKNAQGGGLGQAESGQGVGCTKILHLYSYDADLSVLSGPVVVGEGHQTTEHVKETLLFNGSTSANLKYIPQGPVKEVIFTRTSTFRGSGFNALFKGGDESSTPQKGSYISEIPFPGLSYNEKTNSIVVNVDKAILEPKFYGSVLVSYNVDRFDHTILFSTTNCPQPDDTQEQAAKREDDAKGLILLEYSDGTMSTMEMSRDSACCAKQVTTTSGGGGGNKPEKKPDITDDYEVKMSLVRVQETFEPIYDITEQSANVTEYIFMENFGMEDFNIQGVFINEGTFGITSPDNVFSVAVGATKIFSKVVASSELLALSGQSKGTLNSVPIAPEWSKMTDLMPASEYRGELGIIFGCNQSYYWKGEYDLKKDTVKITGTQHLKADEFVIVDINGVEASVTGVIKVTYSVAVAIYQVSYSTTGEQMRRPNAQVRYVASTSGKGWRIKGSVNSEAKATNSVSKKKPATFKDLLG